MASPLSCGCGTAALMFDPLLGGQAGDESPGRRRRPAARRRINAAARLVGGIALATALAGGCQATSSGAAGQDAQGAGAANQGAEAAQAGSLDETMVIGPTAARTLGYRIAWETPPLAGAASTLSILAPAGDAVFVLDSRNQLTRVRTDDGTRIWQAPVGGPIDRMLGVTRVQTPSLDRVFVTEEGAIYAIDSANGALVDRQRLQRPANTAPVVTDRHLVYGGRTGEVVWQDFRVGHTWRVSALSGAIRVQPLLTEGDVVAASTAGNVAVFDAGSARLIWRKDLLDGVVARPAGGRGHLFVASEDQYLWAFDRGTGRTIWKYFTDAPLTSAPVLIGDRLFQRIPSEGLVCFDAFVKDQPGGRKIWAADVPGQIVGKRGRNLLAWDQTSRVLTRLDERGAVVDSLTLPKAQILMVTAPEDGDLYAGSSDGRIVRLTPQ